MEGEKDLGTTRTIVEAARKTTGTTTTGRTPFATVSSNKSS